MARVILSLSVLAVLVAGASRAHAADLPAHVIERAKQLAASAIEESRDDAHRGQFRVVWPESAPEPPGDGAEVLVIYGFIDLDVRQLVWRGGKVEGLALSARRSWIYNDEGESYEARSLNPAPDEFLSAWTALRMIAEAREERLRQPTDDERRVRNRGWASHTPSRWCRVRDGDGHEVVSTVHTYRGSRRADGTRRWRDIQEWASFRIAWGGAAAPPVGPVPADRWRSFGDATLDELGESLDLRGGGTDSLLLDVALRVAGTVGDEATLPRLKALGSELDGDETWSRRLAEAATRIVLRTNWDPATAERVILDAEYRYYAAKDLAASVREAFRSRSPEEYLALLRRHAADRELSGWVMQDTLRELEAHFPEACPDALAPVLDDGRPFFRVEAAFALERLGHQDLALPTLQDVAADASIHQRLGSDEAPRLKAIEHLVDAGRWDQERMRQQASTDGEDGTVVQYLLRRLEAAGSPMDDDEIRIIWRRMLEGPLDEGTLAAGSGLVWIVDRASYARIAERLDELQAHKGALWRRREIRRLRDAVTPR